MGKQKVKIGLIFKVVFVWIAVVIVFSVPSFFTSRPFPGELYSRMVFPFLSSLPIRFSRLFPFSVTEFFVISGILGGITGLVFLILRFIKTPNKVGFIFQFLRVTGSIVLITVAMYVFLHGINFSRMSILSSYGTADNLGQAVGEDLTNTVKQPIDNRIVESQGDQPVATTAIEETLTTDQEAEQRMNDMLEKYQAISNISFFALENFDLSAILTKSNVFEEEKPFHPTPEQLAEVCQWLSDNANRLRSDRQVNDQGVMVLSQPIKQVLAVGDAGLDRAAVDFSILQGKHVIPKKVLLSGFWSYTGVTGMYFPWFGEANINVDIPAADLPFTICHEVSHVRGIAKENEANLAAFLGTIYHLDLDYQYSGYQMALRYCLNDLERANSEAAQAIRAQLSPAILQDWEAINQYWQKFEGKVQEVSSEAIDTFLKANHQQQGIISYSEVTELIAKYYFVYRTVE